MSLFAVLEELPYPPQKVGSMIKGLMLVDHNQPLSYVDMIGDTSDHSLALSLSTSSPSDTGETLVS